MAGGSSWIGGFSCVISRFSSHSARLLTTTSARAPARSAFRVISSKDAPRRTTTMALRAWLDQEPKPSGFCSSKRTGAKRQIWPLAGLGRMERVHSAEHVGTTSACSIITRQSVCFRSNLQILRRRGATRACACGFATCPENFRRTMTACAPARAHTSKSQSFGTRIVGIDNSGLARSPDFMPGLGHSSVSCFQTSRLSMITSPTAPASSAFRAM
mmetsp:Transcript_52608/g.123093  ORF Transcript_52608/g.123093 Transcript_52608/m.123093 type:complete len:215 (-) Transcript_52608:427-1071(-)